MKKSTKSKAVNPKETRKKKLKEEEKKLELPPEQPMTTTKGKEEAVPSDKEAGTPSAASKHSANSLNSTPQKKQTDKATSLDNQPNNTPLINSPSASKKVLWPSVAPSSQEKPTEKSIEKSSEKSNESESPEAPPAISITNASPAAPAITSGAIKKAAPNSKAKATTTGAKGKAKPVKKEIVKIGGMRGKLGITVQDNEPLKEDIKEESKDSGNRTLTEEGAEETSTLSVGGQNTSQGQTTIEGNIGSGINLEQASLPALDELQRLLSKLEKTKDLTMCNKVASELENTVAKFKQLYASISASAETTSIQPEVAPIPTSVPVPSESQTSGSQHESEAQNFNPPAQTPAPSKATGRRTIGAISVNLSEKSGKKGKQPGPKPSPNKKQRQPTNGDKIGGRVSNPKVTSVETKEAKQEKKKQPAIKDNSEMITEEIKEKVYELYGDDAQFDDIQSQLVIAIRDDKRSKSATPNKSSNYKEVVIKLHNKLVQKEKESEADVLKKSIERQKRAQEIRDTRTIELAQRAKKNKERQQQVKERYAELEAEKHKQIAENEQKLQLADERYEKRINDIRSKARVEGEKVEDLLFIKDASNTNKKALMECRLTETSERRKAILDQTKQKQDMLGQRSEMAEKKRIALLEEQKAKLLQNQQKRDDAEMRRKELIDQRKMLAEGDIQKAAQAKDRKQQLYEEVVDLYNFLCKKENLWEYLETGLQGFTDETETTKLTPFERIKKRLIQDHLALSKVISIDSAGNLKIVKRRKGSFTGGQSRISDDNEYKLEPQSDYENPYPEMTSHKVEKLNRSCSFINPNQEEGEINTQVNYESDQESKQEKPEEKKMPLKQKGKKGKTAKGKPKVKGTTNYSSYRKSVPAEQRVKPKAVATEKKPVEPPPVASPAPASAVSTSISGSKRKPMNITPSVPEFERKEPELMKEGVVLVKDGRSGEYCNNKIILKLVDIEEWLANTKTIPEVPEGKKETTGKGSMEKDQKNPSPAPKPKQAPEEEIKNDIFSVIKSEVVDKVQTFVYSDGPMQIETTNEELIKWIESKEANSVCWCKLCDTAVMDGNEDVIAHIGNSRHQEQKDQTTGINQFSNFILRIVTVPASENNAIELINEKAKLLKKKAKKIKQNIYIATSKTKESNHPVKEVTSVNKNRLSKLSNELEKQVTPHIKDYDLVENTIKEIIKVIDQRNEADLKLLGHNKCIHHLIEICKRVFCCHKNDLKSLGRLLEVVMKVISVFTTLRENRIYLLESNKLIILVELLMWCITNINAKFMFAIPFLPALLQTLTVHVKQKVERELLKNKDAFIQYIYCYGVLNKLKSKVFQYVNGPTDLTDPKNVIPSLLLSSAMFLEAITMYTCIEPTISRAAYDKPHKSSDDAQFVMQQTELYGIIPLLSKILLAKGPFKEGSNSMILPYTIQTLALISIKILNNCCRTNLVTVQTILKSTAYKEQIYHLLSYLLTYTCDFVDNSEEVRELLHEIVMLIGYITLLDSDIQGMFCKGGHTLVQKLCNLPIQYFSDKKLKDILFPTLVSVIHSDERNLTILSQEIDTGQIVEYLKQWLSSKDEDAKDDLSISGTSSVFNMLSGTSPFICFSKRAPRQIWEETLKQLTAQGTS